MNRARSHIPMFRLQKVSLILDTQLDNHVWGCSVCSQVFSTPKCMHTVSRHLYATWRERISGLLPQCRLPTSRKKNTKCSMFHRMLGKNWRNVSQVNFCFHIVVLSFVINQEKPNYDWLIDWLIYIICQSDRLKPNQVCPFRVRPLLKWEKFSAIFLLGRSSEAVDKSASCFIPHWLSKH